MITKQKSPNALNIYLKIFLFIYLFTVLGGAFRKWFISSKQIGNAILFAQILVPFTFLFIKGAQKNWRIGNPTYTVLILVLLIGVINPLNLTIYHGILGFLLNFSFFFILFFYINNRSFFRFELILPILVLAGIAQLCLGFFQYTQPSTSFINTYADVESVGSVALVGNAARITGTFSYISGFTGYLFFNSLLAWAMIKYQYKSIYTIFILMMGLVACFMSGARAATYLYLIILAALFIAEYSSVAKVVFDFRLILPAMIIPLILIGIGSEKFTGIVENAFSGFSERRKSGVETGEETTRIIGDFIELLNFKGNYPYLGVGLGSTYQGATKLFGFSPYVTEYGFYESELIRILLEGGVLLLITRIVVTIYLIRKLLIPTIGKFFLGIILIFFFHVIFNVYNAVFAAFGIILVDYFYYRQYRIQLAGSQQKI